VWQSQQGLKARSHFARTYGLAKAMPLLQSPIAEFFRKLFGRESY
jgi:hypothetical protein